MARKIKFALDMGNGHKVRTLDDLQEYCNIEKILGYFFDGRLSTWLADRFFDEKVEALNTLNKDDTAFIEKLCSILEIDINNSLTAEQIEAIYIRNEKLVKLKHLTSDDSILSLVDSIAFTQKDLDELTAKHIAHIYLCGDSFYIDKNVHDVFYEGICNHKPVINSEFNDRAELMATAVQFKNVKLPDNIAIPVFNNIKIGGYIEFGIYPQKSDAPEPIVWQVLDIENGQALLLSKYGLDCKRYNEIQTNTTWEQCTLRKWLNTDFYNKAFSEIDKLSISRRIIAADKHFHCNTPQGNDTEDSVFLLSDKEINKYFNDKECLCSPTIYAQKQGAWENGIGYGWWWHRSMGVNSCHADTTANDGFYSWAYSHMGGQGHWVDETDGIVRPAIWIFSSIS